MTKPSSKDNAKSYFDNWGKKNIDRFFLKTLQITFLANSRESLRNAKGEMIGYNCEPSNGSTVLICGDKQMKEI